MNIKRFMYCNCISFAQVKYSEKQKSFGHFASGLCAIIGEYLITGSFLCTVVFIWHFLRFLHKIVAKTEMM